MMSDPQKLNLPIDLKNITVDQIIQLATEYHKIVLKSAVIIGTLVIAGGMFIDQRIKEQGIRARMSQAQRKLDVIVTQRDSVKNLDDIKASFPKGIDEDKIITQITAFAPAHDVSIDTLSPVDIQDMGRYDLIKVNVTGVARDYKAMVLFLRAMEKSTYLFRVDSWSGQSNGAQGGVGFTVGISSLHIHI